MLYDDEYIKKSAAIKLIEDKCVDGGIGNEDDYYIGAYETIDDIGDLEPEDVAPIKHGKWIEEIHIDDSGDYPIDYPLYRCSECGELYEGGEPEDSHDRFYHYCPNCGAKMDEEEPIVQWISCSKKLPENNINVLFCNAVGIVHIGWYANNMWWTGEIHRPDSWGAMTYDNIICWKPLPELPKMIGGGK